MSPLSTRPVIKNPPPLAPTSQDSALTQTSLALTLLEDRLVPAGQVTGTAFLDFNANGLLDPAGSLANAGIGSTPTLGDPGVGGVVVTAYDAAGAAQGSATSASNGTYTLTLTGSGPYRLEFTNLPTGLFYGPQATGVNGNATGVQFVANGNTANVNLSVVRPESTTADDPLLITNIYRLGDRAGNDAGEAAIIGFPYSSGTDATDTSLANYATPTAHALSVSHSQVGATWGLAVDANSNRAFAAAFTKRHVGYGPDGPGAIYAMNLPSAATPTVTTAGLFVDLNAITGNAAAGADFRTGGGVGYDYVTDQVVSTGAPGGYSDTDGWNAVGKTGLGGLAVDATGDFIYTIGLADRRLYRIRIPADGSNPTAANVTSFAIPLPAGVTGIGGAGGALGDLRPFAVEIHNGIVYVGAVNSAESTGLASDLRAYVFAFDPAANTGIGGFVDLAGASTSTQPVLDIALNYPRGYAHPGDTIPPSGATIIPGEWNAWTSTPTTLANIAAGERYGIYPQPELTGLAFDDAGNLTLGLRDRAGDQFGNFLTVDFPGTPAPGTKGISAGDTLRAFINTPNNLSSGWTLENNGNGTAGAGNGEGPGGGEFFHRDNLPPNGHIIDDHKELSVGGVLQLPGRNQVLVTQFDPIPLSAQYDAGGVRWFSATDGSLTKAYRAYQNGDPTGNGAFAKSNGIGDLVAASPLNREIGNRVWDDANSNGRQDPGETGIQNVTVVLVSVVGAVVTPLATATTDANGDYYFTSAAGTSTASKRFGVAPLGTAIPAGTSYEVRIPVADAALAGLQLAPFRAAGTNSQNDSDGVLSGSDYAIQTVATQRLGTAQHTNDVGFQVANAQLSGFVYEDNDRSSSRNAGDTAIAGTTVVLTGTLTAGGTITPQTTTTDATGFYQFTGLLPGTYQVNESQPAGYLDFNDQIGTTGGTAGNDILSAIPLVSGANSTGNNFGEVLPAQLSGYVYEDVNTSDVRDGADAPLAGVTVVLTGTDDLGAAIAPVTSTTDGTGFYAFTALRPGDYTVTETQPANFTTRTNNPGTSFTPGTGSPGTVAGDAIQTVRLNSNANSPDNNFGEVRTANGQLSGFVYEDNDRSSSRNGPDAAIAGTTVVLTGTPTLGGTITPRTTTTDGTGFYQFTGLIPGNYTVTEAQPVGYLDFNDQIGSTGGTAGNDVLSAIPVDNAANSNSAGNNFGEVRPVQLSGYVYHDITPDGAGDGVRNGGDAPLAGVTVVLTGTDDLGAAIAPVTSTTDGTGFYAFTALRPGDYTVTETQPADFTTRTNNPGTSFTPGTGSPGTVAGDAIQTVRLNSNANSPDNNFGEILAANAQLSGFVYEDVNRNSQRDSGTDNGIGGATVVLTGTLTTGGTITPRTTTTDGTGAYAFASLQPGTYQVNEAQPAGYLDFNDQIGTTGGTAGNDVLSAIPLASAANSQNNNFGEVRPVQLSGTVYHDVNDDGARNAGDIGLAGVTVVLTGVDDLGATITPVTSTTAANGTYSFTALRPGDYTVSETQPANFTTRVNTPGTVFTPGTGTAGTVVGDVIQTIRLNSNANNPNNDFGEVLTANAQLSGFVYEDVNNSNTRNAGDAPLAGVTVVLTGTFTTGQTITPRTTTTDGTGAYTFTALRPGTYTVTETQPAGYLNRGEQVGTTGGTAPQDGTHINVIPLASLANSQNNNFGEVRPARLSGYVYHDIDNNGVPNAGDSSLAGVTVVLTGVNDLGATITPVTSTTAADGSYAFTALRPGTYTVSETQPAGFTTRTNTAGPVTNGTPGTVVGDTIRTIVLRSNGVSPDNDFGEIIPNNAVISGYVYRDPNLNGVREPGNGNEGGLGGVTVKLFREDGVGVLTQVGQAQTDATGFYSFANLPPGTYRLVETQPVGFYSTKDAPGTTGGNAPGNDTITTIPLAASQNSRENDFGETPRTNLFGYVWVDQNRNGVFDPGEAPIPGAVVNISGIAFTNTTISQPLTTTLAKGSLTATTDVNGRYDFLTLPPGVYNLTQTNTPAGFQDFRSQNASGQSVQSSTATSFGGVFAQAPAQGPLNFGKVTDNPVGPQTPSKLNFLGSSVLTSTTTANPLVGTATFPVNTTPNFAVTTGNPATPATVVVAAGAGFAPIIRVFDYSTGVETFRFQAFEAGMTAGVRATTGDVNGDLVPDIIAVAGPGAGPRVRVFNGTDGTLLRDFFAYPPDFRGGLYVATGDFNGDGKADIVTGAGEGGGPNVRVFDGTNGTLITSFFAFDSAQRGGARIAVGDFNGDGKADIAASNGPGNTSLVRVFNGVGFGQLSQFTPYTAAYTGGVFLGAGDLDGDGKVELVTGADQGGGPNVRTFNALTGQLRGSFFAYESTFTGGVRVTVRDITGDGKADIITGAGIGGASRIRVFSGATLLPVEEFYAFDSGVRTGIYLG